MKRLVYDAKWTTLDTDCADPNQAHAIVESLSKMDETAVRNCIVEGLSVEVNGELQSVTDLEVYIGRVLVEDNTVSIKHLGLKWDSDITAEEYCEKFGEAMYMLFDFEGNQVPFMSYESYEVYEDGAEID